MRGGATVRRKRLSGTDREERCRENRTVGFAQPALVRCAGQPGNHKSYRTKQMGFTSEDFQGKPVVGIVSTWSDLNSCHTHFPQRVEEIKRGVWQAGGFPVVMPALSVGETYVRPSTLIYRNLLAMETRRSSARTRSTARCCSAAATRPHPALIMGAASMNIPAIFVPAGAMLRGHFRGQ